MKKLLLLLPFVAIVGCSPDRILLDELTDQVINGDELHYFKGELFTGSAFDFYSNGKLAQEINFWEGKEDGAYQEWYENGQLKKKNNWKDGQLDGLFQAWNKNGELIFQANYKDGVRID